MNLEEVVSAAAPAAVEAEAAEVVIEEVEVSAAAVQAPAETTTATVGTAQHFEGVSGAINVSIVAFSIVFGVLIVLTATIYAMRLFAGPDKPKDDGHSAGGKPAAKAVAAAPAPVAAPAAAPASSMTKIVAAITAAVLAATEGRGRVLSIQPAFAAAGSCTGGSGSTWRASGLVSLVNNRLTRAWKQ